MKVKERLLIEFECAINSILGDSANKDFEDYKVDEEDIKAIANKVLFYLDLK